MIQEWVNHEHSCLECIKKSVSWLNEFYNEESKLFKVAYSTGEQISREETPNAASSIVHNVLRDLHPQYVNMADIHGWDELYGRSQRVPSVIASAELHDALPLKSFGVLPLFSTCYLAESLASVHKILSAPIYSITIRRILYELYLQQRQQAPQFTKIDPLHPFLLYRCAKALVRFKDIVKVSPVEEKEEFVANLLNEDRLKGAVRSRLGAELSEAEIDIAVDGVFGTGDDASEFRDSLTTIFSSSSREPSLLDNGLQLLELKSLNIALAELSKLQNIKRGFLDPSSLVFSLKVLTKLNLVRHTSVIGQGLKVVLGRSDHGLFRSTLPFHIDKKGRATFVPSVEIVNAVLEIFLRLIDKSTLEEIGEIIDITKSIQDYYVESYNSIEVQDISGTFKEIKGWCSDTAPSVARVDSWVTVHVLAFLVRQTSILRYAKRHFILKKYSWTPKEKISLGWDDIVDPDTDIGDKSAKNIIETIIAQQPRARKKAPVFILYGPPGTSKTTLVNGVAKKMGWDLITLSPSDFIAESMDLIEQQSRNIFLDLMNMDECVVLLDEMDALLRDRELLASRGQGSVIEFVVPAFLPKLQQLRDHAFKRRMAVFFVTNYYETIDRAISRAGRIDIHTLILPYNKASQLELITRMLTKAFKDEPDKQHIGVEFAKGYIEESTGLSRLVTYREVEQLSDLIVREVENGTTPSDQDLAEWSTSLSITPDIYANRGVRAYKEVCAVIGRVLGENEPSAKYTAFTTEDAKTYLRSNRNRLGNSVWYELSERWIKLIDDETTRR